MPENESSSSPSNCGVCKQMETDPNGALEKLGGGAYQPQAIPDPTTGNPAAKHDPKPFNISAPK